MADSRVSTGLTVEQWDDKYFTEYLTENRYQRRDGHERVKRHSGQRKPDEEAWRPR